MTIPAEPTDVQMERLILQDGANDGDAKESNKPKQLRTLSTWKMVAINAFWFGYQFYWFIISIVVVPKQVEMITGADNKGGGLAVISFWAGILNLFVAVIFGALNDRFASRHGKRRLFIAGGTIALSASLLTLSSSFSLQFYGVGYACVTIAAVICSVPFNGLIADITPQEQKGVMSAIMGAMSLAGSLAGAIAGVFIETIRISGMFLLLMMVMAVTCFITIVSCEEESSLHLTLLPSIEWRVFLWDMIKPLVDHRDFRLVFLSRFFFQLGIATVNQFLQYWIGDCVQTNGMPATQAVSMALIPLLVLAPISAVLIPKKKRKIVVYFSACIMIATCLLLEVATAFWTAMFIGGLFGLGYGPFISAEFAMLMDVLPSEEEAAKDIALWHSAMVLPQIFATPAAGWLLDYYQGIGNSLHPPVVCLGYKVTFGLCVVYFVTGTEITRRIRKIE